MKTTTATTGKTSMMSKEAKDQIARYQAKNQAKADIKADAKGEAKAEPVKPAEPVKAARPKPAYLVFLTNLIEAGKHTQKELSALAIKEFPAVAKSTIETVLVDSKNPKYNRFPTLVVKDDKGILTFKKAV